MSLKRKFLSEPEKAAELCLKYYGCKDVETEKITEIHYDTITIPGEVLECPPSYKPIEKKDEQGNAIIDSKTGKPEIEYTKVPGESVKCPDTNCVNTNKNTTTTIKIRDKAQDQVVQDLREENALLKKSNETKSYWILILGSVIGLYIIYRVVKSRFNLKIKLF